MEVWCLLSTGCSCDKSKCFSRSMSCFLTSGRGWHLKKECIVLMLPGVHPTFKSSQRRSIRTRAWRRERSLVHMVFACVEQLHIFQECWGIHLHKRFTHIASSLGR